ncbi:uncharacterized protein LOC107262143 isoform X2 [Ricinus communis]|uniref:uncharacterized protein LOC107262143 isoform X2 n=2 Tax=Ricinus communis TaxID=3988 RepID=UPI00201ABCBF|nr:uncharacterized protein LOC107262143 isoform X2 [Ricinus communis]
MLGQGSLAFNNRNMSHMGLFDYLWSINNLSRFYQGALFSECLTGDMQMQIMNAICLSSPFSITCLLILILADKACVYFAKINFKCTFLMDSSKLKYLLELSDKISSLFIET